MNFACSLGSFGTFGNGPSTNFDFTCGDVSLETQKFEASFDKSVETGFSQACHFQEFFSRFVIKFSDFAFHFSGNDDNFCAFFCCVFGYSLNVYVTGRISNFAFSYVGDVKYRFHGQEVQFSQEFFFVIGQAKTTSRNCIAQTFQYFFHASFFQHSFFVAGFQKFGQTFHAFFYGFHICQAEFGVDDFNVAEGINAAFNVSDVAIFKATNYLSNSVYFADMCQEFVTQTFAFGCAFYQTSDINETHCSRNNSSCFYHIAQNIQSVVRNINYTNVGFNGAERIVSSFRASFSNCVKQGAFANVRQTYDTYF